MAVRLSFQYVSSPFAPRDELVKEIGGFTALCVGTARFSQTVGVPSLFSVREAEDSGGRVTFASHIDGRRIFMGPEESIQIQWNLGSDIAMAFDECVENPAPYAYVKQSCERTFRWLERCKNGACASQAAGRWGQPAADAVWHQSGRILPDLRVWHMQQIASLDCDGYAIGGLAVGAGRRPCMKSSP